MNKLEALAKLVEAHASLSWSAILKLIHDVIADVPKFETAATDIHAVFVELSAGKVPTPQQIAALGAAATAIDQLVADAKAVIA